MEEEERENEEEEGGGEGEKVGGLSLSFLDESFETERTICGDTTTADVMLDDRDTKGEFVAGELRH